MLPDRSAAKAGILSKDPSDPELSEAMSRARGLEATLAGHDHERQMRDKELGWVGRFIGGERNAPMTVAATALILSLIGFGAIHWIVAFTPLAAERIAALISAADKCLALATLALGYVCGKSSS